MMRWEMVQSNPVEGEGGEAAQLPGKRWGHTCEAIEGGRFLYLFGGYGQDNCQTNQVHVFDAEERRQRHVRVIALHVLAGSIFGGCGKSAENNIKVDYNDLYILNTETFVWKYAATSGTPPSPRDGHTCSSLVNKVIVIGGEDGHDYYLCDVHALIWRKLNTSGQLLPPRAGHSTVALGKNLFVFGGFKDAQSLYNDLYKLDIDSGIWTKLTTTGHGPSARFSVAGGCLDPFKGGVLVFIGGCNKNLEALDDMYYLYTEFAGGTEQRPEKLSLRKQLKLKCQEQNVNSLQNRALVRYGLGAEYSLPVTLFRHSQPNDELADADFFNSFEGDFDDTDIH